MVDRHGRKYKGGFYQGYKYGKGYMIDTNDKFIRGYWLYDQLYENIQKDPSSCLEYIKILLIERMQEFRMWVSQNKYVQMIFEFRQFGKNNNYEELSRADDSEYGIRLLYNIYFIFGVMIRPLFIDLIGPFIPFIGYFQLITEDRKEQQCGQLR